LCSEEQDKRIDTTKKGRRATVPNGHGGGRLSATCPSLDVQGAEPRIWHTERD
jgi:hypothetical protein